MIKAVGIYMSLLLMVYFVEAGSKLDLQAQLRATLFIFQKVIPMLPEGLSNDLCSLMPNVQGKFGLPNERKF